MAEFSLELSDDQKQLRDWVHEFADTVIRPAGEEWDEREETPWPIIQEAAKIGLYGMDFMANAMMGDQSGLTLPVVHGGAVLGRRRHRAVDLRLRPGRRRHRRHAARPSRSSSGCRSATATPTT